MSRFVVWRSALCASLSLSLCLSLSLFLSLLSLFLSLSLSLSLLTRSLSVGQSVCLSFCLSLCLFCLSVSLSVSCRYTHGGLGIQHAHALPPLQLLPAFCGTSPFSLGDLWATGRGFPTSPTGRSILRGACCCAVGGGCLLLLLFLLLLLATAVAAATPSLWRGLPFLSLRRENDVGFFSFFLFSFFLACC
jgi:hypothetical protein